MTARGRENSSDRDDRNSTTADTSQIHREQPPPGCAGGWEDDSQPPAPFTLLDAQPPAPRWVGRSARGRTVQLAVECNRYPGAAPFYALGYDVRPSGRARVTRYTPDRDRARGFLTWFLSRRHRPGALGHGAAPPTGPAAPVRRASASPLPLAHRGQGLRCSPGAEIPAAGFRSGGSVSVRPVTCVPELDGRNRQDDSQHDPQRISRCPCGEIAADRAPTKDPMTIGNTR